MNLKFLATCCALAVPLAASAADPVQPGITVVRDPLSGKLRAPTAAELRALGAGRPKALEAPHSTLRPDGTRVIDLAERGLVYSVMTRNADGSLAAHCVKDGDAAARALEAQPESRHDQ